MSMRRLCKGHSLAKGKKRLEEVVTWQNEGKRRKGKLSLKVGRRGRRREDSQKRIKGKGKLITVSPRPFVGTGGGDVVKKSA